VVAAGSTGNGTVFLTDDGGANWRPAAIPFPSFTSISCPSATVCWATGDPSADQLPEPQESGVLIAGSTDGGAQWSTASLQTAPGGLDDGLVPETIACVSETTCWAYSWAYQEAAGTGEVIATTDGWVTQKVAQGNIYGGGQRSLECSSTRVCVIPGPTATMPGGEVCGECSEAISSNAGASWTSLSFPLLGSQTIVWQPPNTTPSPAPSAEVPNANGVYCDSITLCALFEEMPAASDGTPGSTETAVELATADGGETWTAVLEIPLVSTGDGAPPSVPDMACDGAGHCFAYGGTADGALVYEGS
jgi:hypothetical protein